MENDKISMISNNVVELEVITADLERAENLLQIFSEITESEAAQMNSATFDEQKGMALLFLQRHSILKSLITSALDIIQTERDKIDKITTEIYGLIEI